MKRVIGFFLLACVGSVALAQGDVSAGQGKTAVCASCHGATGNSASGDFPSLAGQGEKYLLKQMKDIQCGQKSAEEQKASRCTVRSAPLMAGLLANLSAQDLADIAAFYAAQQPALAGAVASTEAPLALGETIYRAGLADKGVTACAACHAPDGAGNAPAGFPRLSGQQAKYTAAQLKAFRRAAQFSDDELKALRAKGENPDAGRRNDASDDAAAMMRTIAGKMTDREIEAVSNYTAGLH